MVALSKFPKEGIQPINNGDKWRTFVGKGLVHMSHQHLQHYFQHAHPRAIQFGGNTPDGATNMFHLLASLAEAAQDEKDLPRNDPIALVVLDSTNAFNEQKRQSIYDNMMEGCRAQCPPGLPELQGSENSPYGWDILAGYIQAHYSVKGILKCHVNGRTIDILSESGVQQGDTLSSILYAKTAHPSLIRVAEAHPEVIIPSYQDNLVIVGRLSKVLLAHLMLKHELKNLGLRLNPSESEVYIPAWADAEQTSMHVCPHFRRIPQEGEANDEFIQMADHRGANGCKLFQKFT